MGDRWYWHLRGRVLYPVTVHPVRPGLLSGFGPAVSHDDGADLALAARDLRRTLLFLAAAACARPAHAGPRRTARGASFLVASGDAGDADRLSEVAALLPSGALATEIMVFDEPWNSVAGYPQRCFAAWERMQPGVLLATTVEFPNGMIRGCP